MWAGQWDRMWVEAVTLETGRPCVSSCGARQLEATGHIHLYLDPGFHYKLLGKSLDELF